MNGVQLPVGVVVTHGQLAVELVNAAEAIVGDLTHVQAVVESSDLAVLRRVARRATRTGLLADLEHHVEHALAQAATPSEPVAKP